MTSVDLSPGIAFIESFMVDECLITRDSRGVLDDVLNLATGELERPTGDAVTIYQGKCNFRTKLPRSRPYEVYPGEGQREFKLFEMLIPISVVDVELGDNVTPTVSVNDPHLLSRRLRIHDIADGSLKCYRAVYMEEVTYTVKPED